LLENLNIELAQYNYNVGGNCYLTDDKELLLNFSSSIDNTVYTCSIKKENAVEKYCYTIATISENNLSKQEFLSKKF
jgi:hypothetical protein